MRAKLVSCTLFADNIDMNEDMQMRWIGIKWAIEQNETDGIHSFILEGIISLYLKRIVLFSIFRVVLILLESIVWKQLIKTCLFSS